MFLKREDLEIGMEVLICKNGNTFKAKIDSFYEEGDKGFNYYEVETGKKGIFANARWSKSDCWVKPIHDHVTDDDQEEYTGKSVSYYSVDIQQPTSADEPYTAECNDLIEALGMNYAEGNAFKAIWRRCAARKLGKTKKGYGSGLYDAEKCIFFAERILLQAQLEEKENG